MDDSDVHFNQYVALPVTLLLDAIKCELYATNIIFEQMEGGSSACGDAGFRVRIGLIRALMEKLTYMSFQTENNLFLLYALDPESGGMIVQTAQ